MSKTIWVQIKFDGLENGVPYSDVQRETLKYEGFDTGVWIYNISPTWKFYSSGGRVLVDNAAKYSLGFATSINPHSSSKVGPSSNGTFEWRSLTVPDGFVIPGDTGIANFFDFDGPSHIGIAFTNTTFDFQNKTAGSLAIGDFKLSTRDSLPEIFDNALEALGFAGLGAAVKNASTVRDALSNLVSGAVDLVTDGIKGAGDPSFSAADYDARANAYIKGAQAALDEALKKVVLIPGNAAADAKAHEILEATRFIATGTAVVGSSAQVGLDINVAGVASVSISTDVSVRTEVIIDGYQTNDTVYGTAQNNFLIGGPGANRLIGGAGTDYLNGGGGADTLQGGRGSEVFDGGAGNDLIVGIGVSDRAYYSGPSSAYTFTRNADGGLTVIDTRSGSPDGTDRLYGVETLVFTDRSTKVGATLTQPVEDIVQAVARQSGSAPSMMSVSERLSNDLKAGTTTLDKVAAQIVQAAAATTSVATLAYEFFTGQAPRATGIDYLVSPSGINPNNLNAAYYQNFGLENRYINFAVNLGKAGEGNASFTAKYGALSLFDAVGLAYTTIFGAAPSVFKQFEILQDSVPNGTGGSYERQYYFESYGHDGLNGQGTKAAMIGWLLAEAVKADLGTYAKANDAFLMDVALRGAPFGVDLIGVYGRPEYAYHGT